MSAGTGADFQAHITASASPVSKQTAVALDHHHTTTTIPLPLYHHYQLSFNRQTVGPGHKFASSSDGNV